MYCVQCKKATDTSNVQFAFSKNGRNMKQGKCVICGTTKTQFIKAQKGGSLLNKAINNLPFEMHLPGLNFTGPGTKLKKRLKPDLTPKKWSKPINRVVKAAYHHDVCYFENDDAATRNTVCDKNMLKELEGIYNPTLRERLDKSIVSKLIGTKVKFGMGVKKKSFAEELHKPVRRKFKTRRVLVNGIDKIWAADFVDMQAFTKFNRGVKYLLAVIDVFSKYGWLIQLKDKTGQSVASALKTIFKERKPEKMWVDKGKEFYNKHVKDLIELYSTENEEKSSVVERWIMTMKEKMWKYFSAKSTNNFINVLPDLVKEYNNTRHSSIKMTPLKASKKENELRVWRNHYPEHLEIHDIKPKFSVGNKVRISKKKKTFEKGYTTRWTEEIFTIVEVKLTSPVTYKIADLKGEEVKGTFYEPELRKPSQELFRIQKVIKRGKKKSIVKWKGYPTTLILGLIIKI